MFKQNFNTNISWDGDQRNEKRRAEDDDCQIFYHNIDESENPCRLQLFGVIV